MPRAAKLLLALCLVAVVALLATAGLRDTRLAFTLGVSPGGATPPIAAGQTGCQGPIDVPQGGAFDAVELPLGTYGRPGPSLALVVKDAATGSTIARGALAGGYPDVGAAPQQRIPVQPRVPAGTRITVCITNRGTRRVAAYGNADIAAAFSTYTIDGRPTGNDIALRFQRPPRSVLAQFGLIADRAALFRAGWAGAWTYWLLAALLALAVPALLTLALTRATPGDEPDEPSGD